MKDEAPREVAALKRLSGHQVHELETTMLRGLRAARMHRFGWMLREGDVSLSDLARLTGVHRSSVDGWFPHWGRRNPARFEPARIQRWNLKKLIERYPDAWQASADGAWNEEKLDSAVAYGANALEKKRLVRAYDSRKESRPRGAARRFADQLSDDLLANPAEPSVGNGDFALLMGGRHLPVEEFIVMVEKVYGKRGAGRVDAESAGRRLAVLRAKSLLPIAMAQHCLVEVVERFRSPARPDAAERSN